MKHYEDWRRYAEKINKMHKWNYFRNTGMVSKYVPIDLYFESDKLKMYVGYAYCTWDIYYTFDMSITYRSQMTPVEYIPTDRDMFAIVKQIIKQAEEEKP